ncbi:tRNA (N(6)-L-threonylcarbamoyladenosine(37)-C(2))-methylthiotransferase MtaB [Candidatus Kryptobacter tengchongensis]|uniref:tRNA (N(6)-L-threonylcarbamoyladenosine(37)-C(2))- methylthiotransferase MtaB n=1 Tax=Kryptobacter tengchongensis TaxID=1643429 RepID=UPI0007080F3F|nr:tRNA (N(6)-L-threonylcarbamoyladenosine(37)-C(2))-methylthiotransferase MtaB [Candidatus Kryptobacter tengchongensis]CUS90656.1 threonylcarbamoyladenosine tRNA methylthiotransferase MtaB [Candidatus Kryptobacter tengchongensis]
MKKVSFYTVGCKLNFAETSTIGEEFKKRGFEIVEFGEPSDVCVINTCSVTENADKDCRRAVRRALKTSPNAFIIVTGCYAQLRPHEIAQIEGVDLILGSNEKFKIFDYISDFQKNYHAQIFVSPITGVNEFHIASSTPASDRTRAFLKVQDGCDYNCSYCTIPLARGESRSPEISLITERAKTLAQLGYKEIVLSGVNVGDYGRKIGTSLFDLVKELEKINGIERIRISSIEPNLLTEEMIDYFINSEKICNHFHIPLQSGSDEILRKMRRRYNTALYRKRIEYIKEKDPNACIGADVIVGFPGETETHFEATYNFINELPISYLHVFTYSERPNTDAVNLPDKVPVNERHKRSEMLRNLGLKKKMNFYREMVGKTFDVLWEAEVKDEMMFGFTKNYVKVKMKYEPSLVNKITPVKITGVENLTAIGEIVSDWKTSPKSEFLFKNKKEVLQ